MLMAFAAAAVGLGGIVARDQHPLPPEKAELEAFIERWREEAPPQRSKAEVARERPEAVADPRPEEGLFTDVPAPLSPAFYDLEGNAWQTLLGNRVITVYSGALDENPAQGVVVVFTRTLPNPAAPAHELDPEFEASEEQYLTPRKLGSVRIVAERGGLIELQAAQGGTSTFNLASRRFVETG